MSKNWETTNLTPDYINSNPNYTNSQNPEQTVRNEMQPYQGRRIVFTKDELRVLKECNNESFYYRCLPLGVLFIGTTQLLTNRGILKPNKKFGALFKNMAAGLAAFLLGKLSYQGTCREKIMQLQDSPMADALRKGKWGTEVVQDMMERSKENEDSESSFATLQEEPDNKNAGMFGIPSSPLSPGQHHSSPDAKSKTYDQLREQHRKEFEQKYPDHHHDGEDGSRKKFPYFFKSPPKSPQTSQNNDEDNIHRGSQPGTGKGNRKNKWGDEIE